MHNPFRNYYKHVHLKSEIDKPFKNKLYNYYLNAYVTDIVTSKANSDKVAAQQSGLFFGKNSKTGN